MVSESLVHGWLPPRQKHHGGGVRRGAALTVPEAESRAELERLEVVETGCSLPGHIPSDLPPEAGSS